MELRQYFSHKAETAVAAAASARVIRRGDAPENVRGGAQSVRLVCSDTQGS
jgi:hypothetical protein